MIDRLLRRAGITAEAVFTAHRYHAVELTVAAVNDGIRHIIAVGGDTTLHEVVNGLFIQRAVRPEEITLGIIPTGNCRIAGIPKTYPEAVSAIASGYVSLYHIATVSYSQSHYRQERLMAGKRAKRPYRDAFGPYWKVSSPTALRKYVSMRTDNPSTAAVPRVLPSSSPASFPKGILNSPCSPEAAE